MQSARWYYVMGLLSFSLGEVVLSLVGSDFRFLAYIIVSTLCTSFFIRAARIAIKRAKKAATAAR